MVAMVVLIYLGAHVAVALASISFVSVWLIRGDAVVAADLLGLAAEDAISNYVFGVIPLFVLMGLLVERGNLGKDAFDVAQQMFARVRGGLGMATVGANTVFAAVTGVSIASAAVFTRVAVPQMVSRGYDPRFAVGIVAGSSVLGMLIPPSLLMIIYGILAEVSIGDMFIAGIGPGLLLAAIYCVGIYVAVRIRPALGGLATPGSPSDTADVIGGGVPVADRMNPTGMLLKIAPVGLLIMMIFGGIYGGIFTPTEAGAAGALGALVIAWVRGRLDRANLWKLLLDAGYVTASICILFIAATMYSRMLTLSGFPGMLGVWLSSASLGLMTIIAIYVAIIVALGTILDSNSILLIMVPLFVGPMTAMQVDLIWFGIITIIAVEIGLLTPPFGISVFVVKATLRGIVDLTLNDVFKGAMPFAVLMMFTLVLIVLFPWIAVGLLGRGL